MKLRDLSRQQIYNLQRKCEKERKIQQKAYPSTNFEKVVWERAFSKGLEMGLSFVKEL